MQKIMQLFHRLHHMEKQSLLSLPHRVAPYLSGEAHAAYMGLSKEQAHVSEVVMVAILDCFWQKNTNKLQPLHNS